MNELITNNNPTMTLKEITDLLNVRHNDAMKTVKKMAESNGFGSVTTKPYRTNQGNEYETYVLDKRQSLAVSAKLNTTLLMRVIDRWQELENAQKHKIPQTLGEALMLAGQLAIENDRLKISEQISKEVINERSCEIVWLENRLESEIENGKLYGGWKKKK